ncbi:transporter [Salmonella enterica subsp. enterica serovar Choleraesuis]|nr:transporter [Salmonella enterica subsp. enterica serovar Choleraesuis]
MKPSSPPNNSLKSIVYRNLFDINTRSGRWVEFALVGVTLFSVILVMFESTYPPQGPAAPHAAACYAWLEIALTIFFTIEYLLRLLTTPRAQHYPTSFFGIIDLITLLPIYIMLMVPGAAGSYTMLFRMLRVMRILRMIKLMRYMSSANDLWSALVASYKKLLVFFFIIGIIICLFAGAMYVVEGPQHGFVSLPVSIYWAVVTLTTVGYGDITPHTPLGRIITSLLILIGYTIIAIPTGVLSAYMTQIVQSRRHHRRCPHCEYVTENMVARFCANCGEPYSEAEKKNEAAKKPGDKS